MNAFPLRLLSAWYTWGVFVFFLIGAGMCALVTYDTRAYRRAGPGWPLGVGLPLFLLVPGLLLAFAHQDAGLLVRSGQAHPALVRLFSAWFIVGLAGALASVTAGTIYIAGMIRSQNASASRNAIRRVPSPADRPLPAPAGPLANAWLLDAASGQTYQLGLRDTRLGRDVAKSDITLRDAAASREHALIRHADGCFTLFDRGSRSGTLVNGQPVHGPVLLAHGDVITIGDTALEFVADRDRRSARL